MVNDIELEVERQYLARVYRLLDSSIAASRDRARNAKSELWGSPVRSFNDEVVGMWTYKTAAVTAEKYEEQRDAPYFGRVDFLDKVNGGELDVYYIGMASLWDGNDLVVVDWRAPVSGLYYSHDVGKR